MGSARALFNLLQAGGHRESRDREAGDRDLGELEAARDDRLVEAVGELPAEAGEEEERRDEHRCRQRDQFAGVAAAETEQDQDDERVLEKIIVERGKEL